MTVTKSQSEDFKNRAMDFMIRYHSQPMMVDADCKGVFFSHKDALNESSVIVYGAWCTKNKVFMIDAIADDGGRHDDIDSVTNAIKSVRQGILGAIIGELQVEGLSGQAILRRSPVENIIGYDVKMKNQPDYSEQLFIFII